MKRIVYLAAVMLLLTLSVSASPDENGGLGYIPYVYSYEGEPMRAPAAYTPIKTITGETESYGAFKDISYVAYDSENSLYIADSGNDRVVVFDKTFTFQKEIRTFDNQGRPDAFKSPAGLCVANGRLYVADTGNSRILCFDGKTHAFIRSFGKPVIPTQEEGYVYQPDKIAVDYAGRMYVIAQGINQGLIQLDENGEFMSFLGAPKVNPTAAEIIRRKFSTKAQIEASAKFVPTEYNAVVIDEKGFLYVTAKTKNVPLISRLNSQGENVLKYDDTSERGYPDGDGVYAGEGEEITSSFLDAAVREDGSYLALDTEMGRVFGYDDAGNLLYIFGFIGSAEGSFYSPSSLAAVGDQIVVTDKSKGTVTVFAPTPFGNSINQAVRLQKQGRLEEAQASWTEVINQCSNYEIAYLNLARIDIQNGQFEQAMEKLRSTGDKYYYSMSFKERRSEFLSSHFTLIAVLLVLAVAGVILVPRLLRKLKPVQRFSALGPVKEFRYGSHVMFHPCDGFWDLKRERRGSMASALILYLVFSLFYMIRAQYSGYLFQSKPADQVNVWFELARILIPILLWCVSNWCFTTLMEGEGSLRDVFIATGFALKPYLYMSIPLFIMSHVLTMEEAAFYTVLNTATIVWVVGLLFFGMMVTHDYSFGKALLTLLLTLIGICLILFIGILLVNLMQEALTFIFNIYKEIQFRFQ